MNKKKYLPILLLVAIAVLCVLRFAALNADFPAGITTSGLLYTDEGWYAKGAITHVLTGQWYVEGDFNSIVNLPVWQLVDRAFFWVTGMSVFSVRLPVVLSFLVLTGFLLLMIRERFTTRTALLTGVLLLADFHLFAYSRIGIYEPPMLMFLVMAFYIVLSRRSGYLWISLSALLFSLAFLTKSTAIFAVPLLVLPIWSREEKMKEKLMKSGLLLAITAAIILIYNYFTLQHFSADMAYFKQINFNARITFQPVEIVKNLFRAGKTIFTIAPAISLLAVVFTALSWWKDAEFRRNPLVRLMILWIVLYTFFLGFTWYHPPRYFLPLLIPLIVLFVIGLTNSKTVMASRSWTVLLAVVFLVPLLTNLVPMVRYLGDPQYSYTGMMHRVKTAIETDLKGNPQDVILLGDPADSISLETGIRGINSSYGPAALEWKLERYSPRYYITVGLKDQELNRLGRFYKLTGMGNWDVFGNYYHGRKVYLIKLEKK